LQARRVSVLSKEQRQRRIQEIIAREGIGTQAELVERLRAERVEVTQATVSRDINELRLVRLPTGKGRHRYALTPMALETDVLEELARRVREFVHDADRGENIVVLKTSEGHATGVAWVIDRLSRDEIIGTVAGQDTIMIVARSVAAAMVLEAEFQALLV
jgi:transcriptional regulator of arginine metabolism